MSFTTKLSNNRVCLIDKKIERHSLSEKKQIFIERRDLNGGDAGPWLTLKRWVSADGTKQVPGLLECHAWYVFIMTDSRAIVFTALDLVMHLEEHHREHSAGWVEDEQGACGWWIPLGELAGRLPHSDIRNITEPEGLRAVVEFIQQTAGDVYVQVQAVDESKLVGEILRENHPTDGGAGRRGTVKRTDENYKK